MGTDDFDIRSPRYQEVLLVCWRRGRTPSLAGSVLEFDQDVEEAIEGRLAWARDRDDRAAHGEDVSDEDYYNNNVAVTRERDRFLRSLTEDQIQSILPTLSEAQARGLRDAIHTLTRTEPETP